ncbi:unnamed protein product [Calicophoron daubneyi]|uniref:COP9 signalosome complex subunit 4 n=1 Tax=Calicophoron daubneyi TaxID=300641 RepID=A0AAV2TVP8_CALDB
MSDQFSSSLTEVLNCKVPKEANEKFVVLLEEVSKTTGDVFLNHISTIVTEISQDMVAVISARKFFDELIKCVGSVADDALAVSAFQTILTRMQSRNIAFESQLVELRGLLSKRLEAVGSLREAATVLSDIPLESGQRTYPVTLKMDIYLRIAEYYLKLHEISEAEAFVNRASLLQPECQDQQLLLRYKTAYAQLLDYKHKFLEAGQRYAELSIRFPWVDESERLAFLERALAAALLAGAGHQRTRLLATLYKDERCQGFEAYPVLEKMYMGRLINRSALRSLEPLFKKYYPYLLKPTPLETSDSTAGSGPKSGGLAAPSQTVQVLLERAVVEHNMLAASLIYNNISLANLGDLLEISTTEAESVASQMISEDRLTGQIDQIDGVIHFKSQDPVLSSWSTQIHGLCTAVNRIVEDIEAAHPDWVHAQLNARMAVDTNL